MIEDEEGEGLRGADELVGGDEKGDDEGEKPEGEISPSLIKRGRSADLEEGGEEVVGKKVKIDGKLPSLLQ